MSEPEQRSSVCPMCLQAFAYVYPGRGRPRLYCDACRGHGRPVDTGASPPEPPPEPDPEMPATP